jgi:uncharacterized membrane protein YcaP (DUF421 family)
MDPGRILIRCLVSFVFLFTLVRISGKSTVSQGNAFDFVLSLILGDLVDDAIFAEVPISNFLMAAGTLVIMEITVSLLVHRNDRWMWLLEGKPEILLREGNLNPEGMKRESLNELDVNCLMRLGGIEKEKWIQVRLATIEADGEGAILKKSGSKSAQKKDRKWLDQKNA